MHSFRVGTDAMGSPLSPGPVDPLIGRDDEVAALTTALRARRTRLLVLTGPGGVGKTRLALRVAAEVADAFAEGAVFIPLAPAHSPDLVLTAIARGLGIWGLDDRPIEERLHDALQALDLFLILDNFEHLLAAAPRVAEVVSDCPRLTLLVTSRERLNLVDEHDVPVLPLPLPDDRQSERQIREVASVRLFVERAQAALPDFAITAENAATVAKVCRRLDGLPLAIELAAAWTRILSPAALLDRLEDRLPMLVSGPRDRLPRQQSMRETIAWSYDLLTDDEQRVFRRLSVFAGGFTLDGAEAVTTVPSGPRVALGDLATLTDRSLLQVVTADADEPRFSMLETIREFGLEQLAASGEEASVRSAHAAYVLALAKRLEPELYGGRNLVKCLDSLEREHPNIQGALISLERGGNAAGQLRLAAALWRFWLMRGYLVEGRMWLERALCPAEGSPSLRAKALVGLALLAWPQHAQKQALAALDQAVALVEGTANLHDIALARLAQAWIALDQGDLTAAARWATESKARYEQLGWRWAASHATNCLARAMFAQGDLRGAEVIYESLLVTTQEAGDEYGHATARHCLGLLRTVQHDHGPALALHGAALRGYQALGERLWIIVCLEAMATDLVAVGQSAPAARLLGAAAAVRTGQGVQSWFADRVALERTRDDARAALGETAFLAAWEAGTAAPLTEVIDEALQLAAGAASTPMPEHQEAGAAGWLTPRELDVLRLLAEGRSNPAIGAALSISPRTVAGHVEGIFRKLEVDSRAAAAAVAVRHHLI